ncbi:MAG TPA: carboxypeptidase regulatory-like domain-containing protein [Woeseiaceae bacterium]
MNHTFAMADRRRASLGACMAAWMAALLCLGAPVAGFTQETTSAIRGTILGPDGAPEEGATVLVIDTRTGRAHTATTTASGQFNLTGLRVGGPYTVQVQAPGAAPQTVTDVYLDLGDTYAFNVTLTRGEDIDEIVVTGSAIQAVDVAIGPAATFSRSDLETAPAINRSITDVIAIDPRIYVDEGFADAVQCGGASPRFNSLTVDGVAMNDNFGLNSNGFPTERMPFPYDAIDQIAVELAPFDVMYGNFTACNINAVTKSGTNEFHGSLFYDFTNDSLTGDQLEGDDLALGTFEEKRYGFSIGGPIIRDRLFFFAAYEKLEGVNVFDRGAADSDAARPILGVNQAQLDRIRSIAENVYGYDPGPDLSSLPTDDEKYLIKLDLNINDNHRAAYTYTWNDGFNNAQSDDSDFEYEFANHFYERGAELSSHVGQLFSNWTDDFSTEVRVSYSKLDNRQIPLGGVDFGEVQIRTFNDPDGAGPISPQSATVYLGADDSRHANKLKYDTTGFKVAGTYTLDDHVITGGWERQEFDIFNVFIQESEGEYRFDSLCDASNPDGCIDAFESGDPGRITYENARGTNVKEDAAASFGYQINTLYLQDEFPIADGDVTLVAGVRYDWYTSDDLPRENPNFLARNGFSNRQNFDGKGIIQPRLGFNWDFSDRLSFRGGVGLYSGGNPNVWLSNNYSNDGITQVEFQERTLDDDGIGGETLFTIPFNGEGRPIFDIPQSLFDSVASGAANSGVNAVDPNFSIPKEWKFALGATWNFDAGFLGEDYTFLVDYLHTEKQDSALIVDATLEQVGTAPDGRPIYRSIDRSDPACAVDPLTCGDRLFAQDFILSNVRGDDGGSDVWSFSLSKSYDWGLDWAFAYAYTESTDVNPMTSSVAFSNYQNVSVSDPNDPDPAPSNYDIRNRFTLRLNFSHAFFGDNLTKFTLFGHVNEGRPFSPTFFDAGFVFGDTIDFRHLLYIPSGPDDPNVVFAPGFDQEAFFAYLADSGLDQYGGEIAPRNSLRSSWWHKYDIRIEQELPGFNPEHRFAGFLIIENVGNLINDDWGVMKEQSFPRNLPLVGLDEDGVDGGPINDQGQYVYSFFQTPAPQGRVADASLWEVRLGVKYNF